MLNPAETTQAPDAAATPQNSVFTIKDMRPICRGRTLRLQVDDAIIAVDGQPFTGDVDLLLDLIYECDPQTGIFLTIFREGCLFHVIARGPLGCAFEYAKPEIAEAFTLFKSLKQYGRRYGGITTDQMRVINEQITNLEAQIIKIGKTKAKQLSDPVKLG